MIEFIIICSLAFYGAAVTQCEGMIFYNVSKKLDKWFEAEVFLSFYKYGKLQYKRSAFVRSLQYPLYACPKCMPSIWGSAAYWITYYDNSHPIGYLVLMWILSVLAMAGVVNILMYQFPYND